MSRRDELAANLSHVEARIQRACRAAGRPRDAVALVAVTKTWPLADCCLLKDLGVTDLGENRDQEAADKAAALDGVRWHFVGAVQTNKARSVASYADVVHSVDRPSLVSVLGDGAVRSGRTVEVLLQVSLDGDPDRGGAAPDAVPGLAEQVVLTEGLRLGGVMAVAPLGADPAEAFARLADVAARLRADHPQATAVSAGMTGDLEQAVAAGATHLRVGPAVLGARPASLR
ncbi:MAG: alanine racemase domain protein [Frankiales bacterium]|nr:alanine racemase domain protein [Frankiales bacterium]